MQLWEWRADNDIDRNWIRYRCNLFRHFSPQCFDEWERGAGPIRWVCGWRPMCWQMGCKSSLMIGNGLTIIRARRWRVQKSREFDAILIWVYSVVGTIQTYGGTAPGMVYPRKFLSFEFLRFIIWFRGLYVRHDATILFVYYSLNGRRRGIHIEVLPGVCSPMRTSAIWTWLASPARLKKGFHISFLPQH